MHSIVMRRGEGEEEEEEYKRDGGEEGEQGCALLVTMGNQSTHKYLIRQATPTLYLMTLVAQVVYNQGMHGM